MKKAHAGFIATAAGISVIGGVNVHRADAGVTSPSQPTQCIVPDFPQTDATSAVVGAVKLPGCASITTLCILYAPGPAGLARAPHVVAVDGGPCSTFAPECVLTVTPSPAPAPAPVPAPPGVGRGVHGAARAIDRMVPSDVHPGDVFDIPQACQQLPSTGLDTTSELIAGTVVAAAGAAVVAATTTRRRRFRRAAV